MTPESINSETPLTPQQVSEKGQQIYNEKLKSELEPDNRGKFLVIEVESGEFFLGDTIIEALQKAKDKYPTKLFHTVRIGYEGIFKMGTYARRGYGWVPPK